ncbi:MAG: F0F1 ATP synthase subunit B [bacterium]
METLLNPDIGLMIWTVVIFVILVFVLAKIAWKPLIESIENREKRMQDDISAARETREGLERLKNEYQQKLLQNDDLLRRSLDRARTEGDKIKEEILFKAKEEAKIIYQKTQEALNREKEQLIDELKQDAVKISIDATERLLKRVVDKKIQEKFIHEFFDDLDKHSKEIH